MAIRIMVAMRPPGYGVREASPLARGAAGPVVSTQIEVTASTYCALTDIPDTARIPTS